MHIRLSRLLRLLDAASNSLVRGQAADQLATSVDQEPEQLQPVLEQLSLSLCSAHWSTRAAAGQALQQMAKKIRRQIDAISAEVPPASAVATPPAAAATVATASSSSAALASTSPSAAAAPLLSLSTFSPSSVIAHGTLLLASSGREFSSTSLARHQQQLARLPPHERVLAQRRELLRRIGCHEGRYEQFAGVDAIIQEDDVDMTEEEQQQSNTTMNAPAAASSSDASAGRSARERNKARRDAKKPQPRERAADMWLDDDDGAAESQDGEVAASADPADIAGVSPPGPSPFLRRLDGALTLMPFVSRMLWQLLDVDWEARHGAALAIRAVCMHLAPQLACDLRPTATMEQRQQSRHRHQAFLSDVCARLLCLLVLDRFGDYTAEQTSCPVREVAAHILALLANELEDAALRLLVRHLKELAARPEGDLRYGAFLGLKYVLAVRFDPTGGGCPLVGAGVPSAPAPSSSAFSFSAMNLELLAEVVGSLIAALADSLDDVRGMVADSLTAIVDCTPIDDDGRWISPAQQSALTTALWASLRLCDDLASSTVRGLHLLHKVLSRQVALFHSPISVKAEPSLAASASASSRPALSSSLSDDFHQLSPFLGHALASVKLLVWQVTLALLAMEEARLGASESAAAAASAARSSTCSRILRLAYQSLAVEEDVRVHSACFDVMRCLTQDESDQTTQRSNNNNNAKLVSNSDWPTMLHPDCWLLLFAPLFQPLPSSRLIPWRQGDSAISFASSPTPPLVTLEMKLRLSRAVAMVCHRVCSDSSPPTEVRQAMCARLAEYLASPNDLYVQMACLVLCNWSELATNNGASSATTWTCVSRQLLEPIRRLIQPKAEEPDRVRSPNTRSLLAQAALCLSGTPTGFSSDVLRSCIVAPLVFTLEHEANFQLLQERCARYLSRIMWSATTRQAARDVTGLKKEEEEAIKQEATRFATSPASPHSEPLLRQMTEKLIALTCATLPAEPDRATPSAAAGGDSAGSKPAGQPARFDEDIEMTAEEDELLAMLQEEDGAAENEEKSKEANEPKKPKKTHAGQEPVPVAVATPAPVSPAIAERGGTHWLIAICRDTPGDVPASSLLESFPTLLETISSGISDQVAAATAAAVSPSAYARAAAFQLLRVVVMHAPKGGDHREDPLLLAFLTRTQALLFAAADDSPIGRLLPGLTQAVLVCFAERRLAPFMEALLRDLLPILSAHTAGTSSHGAIGRHSPPPLGGRSAKIRILQLVQALFRTLALPLVPYLPFLLPPVLSCMSDASSHDPADLALPTSDPSGGVAMVAGGAEELRSLACDVFGTIMALIPLEGGMPSPKEMSTDTQQRWIDQRAFLRPLLEGAAAVDAVEIPMEILQPDISLRQYQRDGIRWLLFLQRYHLHGALCDEMGVGKSCQAAIAMASTIYQRRQRFLNAPSSTPMDAASKAAAAPLPSLILCPSTLVHHWQYEIRKFIRDDVCPLELLVYAGDAKAKEKMRQRLKQGAGGASRSSPSSSVASSDCIVIMSYDSLRKDASHFAGEMSFLFLLLDEGHLIKNDASQLSRAIKGLRSRSRVVLTGTPLSNHVLELWSLVDFLLPGYLGSARDFRARYARPIEHARRSEMEKATNRRANEEERDHHQRAITSAGHVALEQLHRRVLPFFLRRLKADVLKELPPKVIQDYYVDLSPLQRDLYALVQDREDEMARAAEVVIAAGGDTTQMKAQAAEGPAFAHTFQALQYLRKLCSSPAHVLTAAHPQFARLQAKYFSGDKAADVVTSAKHSAKLGALRELLVECGIGVVQGAGSAGDAAAGSSSSSSSKRKRSSTSIAAGASSSEPSSAEEDLVAPTRQRVLIFAQLKSTLDRVEQDLFNHRTRSDSSGSSGGDSRVDPDGFVPGSVRFLRLDGSTPTSRRFELVQRFNAADAEVDCLLLTTSVGGLGLNLASASTVIFLEHSYNPQQDLQAMDRAHRIGQQAAKVHVYRILCADTLEERLMSLQRFKLHLANSVVNADNASMKSMDTDQVLERLQATTAVAKPSKAKASAADREGQAIASATGMDANLNSSAPEEAGEDELEAESMAAFLASFRGR